MYPKKILVGVDGSECSFRAVDLAISLAKKLQSKVCFIFVAGFSPSIPNYRITADMVGSIEKYGRETLSKCESSAKIEGISYETILNYGDPVDEILSTSGEKKCDCIVLGKTGHGRLEKLLVGSVSSKVTTLADIPVILVK